MGLHRHIPNAITSLNLVSGALGVVSAVKGMPEQALAFMLAAALFDFCDGLAARLLKAYSPIGKELDSLADMVSFGLLPALLLMACMQAHGVPAAPSCVALFIAVMSAIRLAKFNVDERQGTDFLGVPTPTCALVCASLAVYVAVSPGSLAARWAGTVWFLPLVSVALGLLLVCEIPMFGMKVKPGHRLLDGKRVVFLALSLAAILAVALTGQHFSLAVLAVFTLYILENLLLACRNVKRR